MVVVMVAMLGPTMVARRAAPKVAKLAMQMAVVLVVG